MIFFKVSAQPVMASNGPLPPTANQVPVNNGEQILTTNGKFLIFTNLVILNINVKFYIQTMPITLPSCCQAAGLEIASED